MAFPEEPESGVEGWKKTAALKALLEQPSASEDRHDGKAFETASQYQVLEAVRHGCPLIRRSKQNGVVLWPFVSGGGNASSRKLADS